MVFLLPLSFVALDVETANGARGSVCSFGLAIVEGGAVVATHSLLCRPPQGLDAFDAWNVRLHGISADDVADAPSFSARLAEVVRLIDGRPVVCHNASFDIGALREGCNASGVDWPTLSYACSLIMSRRASLSLLSYRLPVVCESLGIAMRSHHQADHDAEAAARIVLALAQRGGVDTLDALASTLMVRLGQITRTDWAGCVRWSTIAKQRPPDANADADPDHPLHGRLIAFTGGLSILRADAMAAVASMGAVPQIGPTRTTDFLVIGDGFAGNSAADFHTGKAAKAVKINGKGGRIEVLTEADLLEMLAEPATSGARMGL